MCFAAASDFAERKQFIVDSAAHPKTTSEPGYATIAARLYLREDLDWCSRRLEQLLKTGPTGDMFWMFPATAVAYLDQGQLTSSARTALRQAWNTYAPYRGDTEN